MIEKKYFGPQTDVIDFFINTIQSRDIEFCESIHDPMYRDIYNTQQALENSWKAALSAGREQKFLNAREAVKKAHNGRPGTMWLTDAVSALITKDLIGDTFTQEDYNKLTYAFENARINVAN